MTDGQVRVFVLLLVLVALELVFHPPAFLAFLRGQPATAGVGG